MPDSWVALTLPSVIWLFSALIVVGSTSSSFNYGTVGALAWLVFIAGIAYFVVNLFS